MIFGFGMAILFLGMTLKIRAKAPGQIFFVPFRHLAKPPIIVEDLTHLGQIAGADERSRAL